MAQINHVLAILSDAVIQDNAFEVGEEGHLVFHLVIIIIKNGILETPARRFPHLQLVEIESLLQGGVLAEVQ